MATFYIFLMSFVCAYIAYVIGLKVIKPYLGKRKKSDSFIDPFIEENKFNYSKFEKKMLERVPEKSIILRLMHFDNIELARKIKRLGLDTTAKKFRKMQATYSLLVVLVGLIMAIILSKGFMLLGLIGGVATWFLIENRLINKPCKVRDKAVIDSIPELFTIFYYSYRLSVRGGMQAKIRNFIRDKDRTDPLFKEMVVFLEDSEFGDIEALRQLRTRVPNGNVIRFCNLLEQRLLGYDNVDAMTAFKNEIHHKELQNQRESMEILGSKLENINKIGVGAGMGVLVLFFLASIIVSSM